MIVRELRVECTEIHRISTGIEPQEIAARNPDEEKYFI
jgi:hypothetical protein